MRAPGENDLITAITSLRATRWFTDEAVNDEDLRRVLEAARWTGSARNRQPWRFVVVRGAETRRELSLLGLYAAHLASAPVVVALAVQDEVGNEDGRFDAGRAAQNLMIAADSLGLGSCPASFFPHVNADRAGHLCRVSAPWRVRTAISLGHPAPAPTGRSAIPTGRIPLPDLVTEIHDR